MKLQDISSLILVGAGKMGLALAKGWVRDGLPGTSLVLVDPNPHDDTIAFAQSVGASLISQIRDEPARAVVLAVKPQIAEKVMASIRSAIGSETLVLSVIAGISIKAMQQGLGTNRIVRTIPNTPAQIGKGVTGAYGGDGVSEGDNELANALLFASGTVVWVPRENLIDAVTSVSGSGPAYVFLMAESMAAAGVAQGLEPDVAMVLARQTIIGAAALMDTETLDASVLRKNVTSPNGTTAAALEVLMAEPGLTALMTKAIHAAHMRSRQLGE